MRKHCPKRNYVQNHININIVIIVLLGCIRYTSDNALGTLHSFQTWYGGSWGQGQGHRGKLPSALCPPLAPPMPQSTRIIRFGRNARVLSQAATEAKTVPEFKHALKLIWSGLPEKAIDDAVKDYRKWLQACVSANSGHFEHTML